MTEELRLFKQLIKACRFGFRLHVQQKNFHPFVMNYFSLTQKGIKTKQNKSGPPLRFPAASASCSFTLHPSEGIPIFSCAVSSLHLWALTCSGSHIVPLWESLFVCVRGAVNQLCSPGEGTALLTDPFKGNMVERVVKVGQGKYKT